MRALREQAQAMELDGMKRIRIALELRLTAAQVTRLLGPVRQWMGKRLSCST